MTRRILAALFLTVLPRVRKAGDSRPLTVLRDIEYQKVKAPVQFEVVHGAAHGGAAFYDADSLAVVNRFLRRSF